MGDLVLELKAPISDAVFESAFSLTYTPNADGAIYWPGPGVKLLETKTLRDWDPNPDERLESVIGKALLITV